MRAIIYTLFLSLLLPVSLPAQEEPDPAPAGRWLSEKKDTVVRIERCEDSLCGYIDWLHPDEDQFTPQGQPMCGQKVMWGFERSNSNKRLWRHGTIYKADDDKEFSARITQLGPDELKLRGYLGFIFLGKSYIFTRVKESVYPPCAETSTATSMAD